MRRRLRRQRQMREALLLDLGALVYELHRQGRREPELLQAKAAELTAVDEEVRALAEALGTDHSVMQLVATGVAGSCENCGSLMSVDQRYCSSCGASAVPALSTDGERPAMTERTDEYAALSVGPDEDGAHDYEAAVYEEGEGYEAEEYDSHEFEQLEEDAFEPAAAGEPPEEGVIRVSRMAPEEEVEAEAVEPPETDPEPEGVEPEAVGPEPEPESVEPEALEPESADAEPEPEAIEPEPVEPEAAELEPEAVEPEPEPGEPEPEPEPGEPEPEPGPAEPEPHVEDSDLDQPGPASDGEAPANAAATPAGRRAAATPPPPRAIADDALDSAGKAIRTGIERGREWLRGRRDEP